MKHNWAENEEGLFAGWSAPLPLSQGHQHLAKKTWGTLMMFLALPALTVHNSSHLLWQGQTILFLNIRKVQTASLSNRWINDVSVKTFTALSNLRSLHSVSPCFASPLKALLLLKSSYFTLVSLDILFIALHIYLHFLKCWDFSRSGCGSGGISGHLLNRRLIFFNPVRMSTCPWATY